VAARSATLFRGPAAALVHALKYEGWTSLTPFLGERMCRCLDGRMDRSAGSGGLVTAGAVVPVPSTPKRLRERGFNPARLLAEAVSERLRIPLLDALLRVRDGPRQIGLPPSQRAANVRDVFVPNGAPSGPLLPEHVLLVDDVLTTGATGVEAAKAAASLGARRITLLTFARALPELPGSAPEPVHFPEGVN
jgi:predicted amidophosphoribosyltransferase